MKLLLARLAKNKQGQVARTDEVIEAESILIGRGTDCKLHLPDPRVGLHHATIQKTGADRFTIDAPNSAMMIDARAERASLLRPGQQIQLGPYRLGILPPPDGIDVALTIELSEPLADRTIAMALAQKRTRGGLAATWLSKRALSWLFAALVGVGFLAWPVYHSLKQDHYRHALVVPLKKSITPDGAWDPGPLDSGHASFGRNCAACHQTPFVQVRNDACESCHKAVGWHFPHDTDSAKKLHAAVFSADGGEGRCAACHRDHKGVNALKRQDSPLCTDCHLDLKTRHPAVGIPNVTDFKTDHPPFKLSMLVAGKTGNDAVIRVSQLDKVNLVAKSNLKFPHDVHLAATPSGGLRSPNGMRAMECKNCHVPDETGTRFKPITMKEHCQACHSLEFEPKASQRQVPHGRVEDVIAMVNEFYAEAALLGKPIDQPDQPTQDRMRAGTRQAGGPVKSIAWVRKKADTVVTEMMEKRTCFICHEISRDATAAGTTWKIAPIAMTRHWLPKSRFPHNQHATFDCKKCHDAGKSKSSADVLIPDLANCQSCHSGSDIEKDKAPGTCESCHGFHVGGSRAGKPVILPKPNGGGVKTFKHSAALADK